MLRGGKSIYWKSITKYRAQDHLIVYLDETWYDLHDIVKEIWTDSSKEFNPPAPVSKGKSVVICLTGSADEGLVDLFLWKWHVKILRISKCYHKNMNGKVFESWFGDKLIPNFPFMEKR